MAKAFGIRIQLKYNIHFQGLEWNFVIYKRYFRILLFFSSYANSQIWLHSLYDYDSLILRYETDCKLHKMSKWVLMSHK